MIDKTIRTRLFRSGGKCFGFKERRLGAGMEGKKKRGGGGAV